MLNTIMQYLPIMEVVDKANKIKHPWWCITKRQRASYEVDYMIKELRRLRDE